MSDVQQAQTIVAIIAGATVVVGAIVLLAVIMLHRERRLRSDMDKQTVKLEQLQKDLDDKKSGHKQFETLEDLMKPYKKHLLQSAFDLQSRLSGQVRAELLCATMHACMRLHAWDAASRSGLASAPRHG